MVCTLFYSLTMNYFHVENSILLIVSLYIMKEVRQLEVLCKNLYESTNATERADAEKALVGFQVCMVFYHVS